MREPPHSLADFGSFSRFRLQEKHNASFYQYVLHSLWNARAKLRKRNGINDENEKNVRGDGFSFSVWALPPLSYLRYPRYRNYGNGYVVITSVGMSVVGEMCVRLGVCPLAASVLQCCSVAVLQMLFHSMKNLINTIYILYIYYYIIYSYIWIYNLLL